MQKRRRPKPNLSFTLDPDVATDLNVLVRNLEPAVSKSSYVNYVLRTHFASLKEKDPAQFRVPK